MTAITQHDREVDAKLSEISFILARLQNGEGFPQHVKDTVATLDKVVMGDNESLGLVHRMKRLEEFMNDLKRVGWIIVGILASAVVVQLINIIVTHWKVP